jgi:hypothetical protein
MWGFNLGEHADPPPGVTNPVSIALPVGSYLSPCAAVNSNGAIVVWGAGIGPSPEDLTNVADAAGGSSFLSALRKTGTVEVWGSGSFIPTNVPVGLTNITAIAAGEGHVLALTEEGTVAAWGSNEGTNVPTGLSNVISVDAEVYTSFVLKSDGAIQGWGPGYGGPSTTIPPGTTNVAALAVGAFFGLVLKNDGTVTNWAGPSSIRPPAGLSNIVSVSAGSHHALALRSDGTLVSWSYSGLGETNIPEGLSNVIHIASGVGVSGAIVGDGRPAFATTIPRRTVHTGSTLQLPAFAASSLPMSYQWFFNGTLLTNQTNATLLIQNVPVTVAGDYTVVVSNAVGVVTSAVITVTVTRDPLRFDTSAGGLNMTNEALHLRLTGLAGAGAVVLQASTNVVDWEPIYTNPAVVGPLDLTDETVTNNPTRFYRAIEGP